MRQSESLVSQVVERQPLEDALLEPMMLLKEKYSTAQKTAYEMSLCDWSSDVCSSDLLRKDLRKKSQSL